MIRDRGGRVDSLGGLRRRRRAGDLSSALPVALQVPRDDAERRFRQANAVLSFQKRMFALADPNQEGVLVEDLLDRGALMIGETSEPVDMNETFTRRHGPHSSVLDVFNSITKHLQPFAFPAIQSVAVRGVVFRRVIWMLPTSIDGFGVWHQAEDKSRCVANSCNVPHASVRAGWVGEW